MEESFNCFFGLEVTAGKPQKVVPEIGFLHVSQAAVASPNTGKSTLTVKVEGKSFTVGTLSPSNGTYHMPLDMNFMPESEVEFSVHGDDSTKVHLTGYYELDDAEDDDAEDCLGEDAELGSEDMSDDDEENDTKPPVSEKPKTKTNEPVSAKKTTEKAQSSDDEDEDDSEDFSGEDGEETESGEEDESEDEADESDDEEGEEGQSASDDDDDENESSEDEMPQKKGKGNQGGSFSKPQHGKGFQHNHKDSFRGKQSGDNRVSRGGFQSGNFNGGNRFGGNRGGSFNPHRGGSRGQSNRGGRFDRGGKRGGFRGRH